VVFSGALFVPGGVSCTERPTVNKVGVHNLDGTREGKNERKSRSSRERDTHRERHAQRES
jgi:hypothetical protein